MARSLTRRISALTAVGVAVAVAAPALAAPPVCTTSAGVTTCVAGVTVSITGLGGTRQFSVEDISGAELTALDLGTGGAKPFRTHVTDSAFLPTSTSNGNYSVAASLSNLYLKPTASTFNYGVKIPSSDLAIGFGSSPLAAQAVSLVALPQLTVSGTLAGCANLSGTLKTTLGLSTLGLPLDVADTALVTLCTTLGTAGAPVTAVVDGALQTLTPAISSLLDLPSQLAGATGGTFTNPSFAAGTVGAGDTAGAAGAPAATSVSLMTGTRALSAGLLSALTTALNTALAGLPLVNAASAPAKSTVEAVVAGLSGASTTVETALSGVLSGLTATEQAAALNEILASVVPVPLDLTRLQGVNAQYFAFPILQAAPRAPVAGSYGGTMTVTFVQS